MEEKNKNSKKQKEMDTQYEKENRAMLKLSEIGKGECIKPTPFYLSIKKPFSSSTGGDIMNRVATHQQFNRDNPDLHYLFDGKKLDARKNKKLLEIYRTDEEMQENLTKKDIKIIERRLKKIEEAGIIKEDLINMNRKILKVIEKLELILKGRLEEINREELKEEFFNGN